MAYPRFQRSRTFKKISRTSGNLTLNSTSWADLPVSGAMDLTIEAQTNDEIEAGLYGLWYTEAVTGRLDVATVVSGAALNSVGTPGCWVGGAGFITPIAGAIPYTAQAGDIVSGKVTMRIRYKTDTATAKTLFADAADSLWFVVKNLGPAEPH